MRYCIAQANSTAGANTITFDATVFATPQTIILGGTQLALTNTTRDRDDHGPGGGRDGQRQPREPGVPGQPECHGVDLGTDDQRGHRDRRRRRTGQPWGTVTLTNVTLSGNTASTLGGGLYNKATATLTNVTLSGNTAGTSGGGLWSNGTVDADRLHRQRQLRHH